MENLEELTLKDLQEKLRAMDFEGAEHMTSKAQVIAIINALDKKEKKANRAIDDNTSIVSDNVKEDREHYSGKALIMKNWLQTQPKVPYAIPLGIGEKKGAFETVQRNGYRLSILKGVIVSLPLPLVEQLMESYNDTMSAGSDIPNSRGGTGISLENDAEARAKLGMA